MLLDSAGFQTPIDDESSVARSRGIAGLSIVAIPSHQVQGENPAAAATTREQTRAIIELARYLGVGPIDARFIV
jgi:hypothetical protein